MYVSEEKKEIGILWTRLVALETLYAESKTRIVTLEESTQTAPVSQFNLLEVNSENPGKLISNYNSTDHPLMDALDKGAKLADAVEKLSNIPGFSKLASNLERKGKKLIDVADKRVSAVLDEEDNCDVEKLKENVVDITDSKD